MKKSNINEHPIPDNLQHTQDSKSLTRLLEFEQLISELSTRFVNISSDKLDTEIQISLKRIYEFFNCDRCALLEGMPDEQIWEITHIAAVENAPAVPVGSKLPAAITPWVFEKLVKKEIVSFSNLDDLPAEANIDKQTLREWGIRSNLSIPIIVGGSVTHIIAINATKNESVWPRELVSRVQLLGELFVNALERRKVRLQLEEQLAFEMLLTEISARFINMPVDQIDSEIEDAQRRVCESIGLDLSTLWQLSMETPHNFTMTHFYRRLEGPPPAEPMNANKSHPWSLQQIEAGRIIKISSMEDYPAEAARDRETSQHFGVKSILTFPLSVGGSTPVGALSFQTMQHERTWTKELIARLQMVAQVFVNALARKQGESALRESEARLSMATEAVGAGLWSMDIETKKVWVSPKGRELFHFSPDEEIAYETYFRVIHPEDRDIVQQAVQNAIEHKKQLLCDYRIVLPDGNIRWIVARGRLDHKSTEAPARIMGLSLDITARKKMELQLEESQTLLSTLINSTPDLIWSVDAKRFGLLTFNRGLTEYFLQGTGLHIKAGMNPDDLLPEESARKWHIFYRRTLEEGSFITEYQASAQNRILRLNFNTLKNMDVVFGISAFAQDITMLKEMENQLRQQLAEINKLKLQLEKENVYLREEIKTEMGLGAIIGESDAIKYVLFRSEQVAPTDAAVLIQGETGTGKGMIALAIHEMSTRKDKPMVTINCAAIPENLIESELFGREKGAFTGAHAKQIGRFEIADGGTIFLDEIGEMPLSLQTKLLRVLQDGEFERLGSNRTIKVDVRVIAATSRNLKTDVSNGRFREDLFYRLNVFPVSIPPLRARLEDIPLLVKFFISKYAHKYSRQIEILSKSTLQKLQSYHWPGNVRELEHVIERAVIVSQSSELDVLDNLEVEVIDKTEESIKKLETTEREHILKVLQKTRWKIDGEGGAATLLGLKPSTLRFRIKKLGIIRPGN
ncbi:MAG: sigma 54-interacting transcriptional regulator [Syntrophaceae bacterium]|nr:sigma 54-interacting transcriptional regulator [Syntrophaceae bacterium]